MAGDRIGLRNNISIRELEKKAKWVRQQVFEMCLIAGAGHIAPALSCTEILVALYHGGFLRVNPSKPSWEGRDRFILSKGHGCAALYAVLADLGFISISELQTFTSAGSRLGGHAESNIPGIEASTGSLGHGLPMSVGMALAAKMDGKDYLCVPLLGDGECQEGSIWEAAMLAGHHHLDNLIVIVDRNMVQSIDFTEDAVALEPFSKKWEAFNWDVNVINGHSFNQILTTLNRLRSERTGKPKVVIAKTTKGKGISYMENKPIWHYRVPDSQEEIEQARKELAK
jgi:transketolase